MQGGISVAAVICAAGSSKRMGGGKKEYLRLNQDSAGEKPVTVLGAAAAAFASCPEINPIVIVLPGEAPAGLVEELRALDPHCGEATSGGARILFVKGGPSRRASVYNALAFLRKHGPSHVLIHDGARPWIKRSLIEEVTSAAIRHGAAIPALPMTETPKELESPLASRGPAAGDNFIRRHLKRNTLCAAQTPQGFRFPEILAAHEKAAARETLDSVEYTDDAEIWGEFSGKVAVVPGDPENRKITYPEDLAYVPK